MKFTRSIAIVMLTLCGSAGAARQDIVVPRLTGELLVEYFSGEAGVSMSEQKPDSILKMRFADGYLAGVADSSEGTAWCNSGRVKATEVNSMVVADLRKMGPEELQRPAAHAVVRSLRKRFPC